MLKEWKVDDVDIAPDDDDRDTGSPRTEENINCTMSALDRGGGGTTTNDNIIQHDSKPPQETSTHETSWDESEGEVEDSPAEACKICGVFMPSFAMAAHHRFHTLPD